MKGETIDDLLNEMAHDNPRPEEPWFALDDFDPQFNKGTIRAARRLGLVEVDEDRENVYFAWRFTPKGRDRQEQGQ